MRLIDSGTAVTAKLPVRDLGRRQAAPVDRDRVADRELGCDRRRLDLEATSPSFRRRGDAPAAAHDSGEHVEKAIGQPKRGGEREGDRLLVAQGVALGVQCLEARLPEPVAQLRRPLVDFFLVGSAPQSHLLADSVCRRPDPHGIVEPFETRQGRRDAAETDRDAVFESVLPAQPERLPIERKRLVEVPFVQ